MSDSSVSRRVFMAAAAAAPAASALVAADTSDRIRIFDPPPTRIRILCTRVGAAPGFTPAELEQLKEMLTAGLITQQDYDEKKKEILGRM